MIKEIGLVSNEIGRVFLSDVADEVNKYQDKGLEVDVQYKYEDGKHIAFITGRTKNNVQG